MRRTSLRRPESLTDKYRILGKIGEGTYGIVFKAEALSSALLPRPSASSSSSSGGGGASTSASKGGGDAGAEDEEPLTFAIKLVKSHKEGKNDVVLSSATVREIKLLRELQHDNVVHLHDVHLDPRDKMLALVFEYADHDLHDIIVQSKQKPLSEYARKSLMFQILKGVDYMHDAWVMHRDMKPQNILVVGHGRRRGQVKLGDFGLARLYKEPIKALSDVERVVVTLWYRAPELLLGAKHYTKAVDLWAVGCIFAEIINTRELFCGKEVEGSNAPFQKDQLDKIFKVLGIPSPQSWEGLENLPEYAQIVQMGRERKYPPQSELKNAVKFGSGRSGAALHDLISRLLEFDPELRLTAKAALEHEYFTQIEPEPRDWAFDEPGKEPVSFRTQTVEPVVEDSLPWKIKKDAAPPVAAAAAAAADANGADGGGSPHRDRERDGGRSQHHHSSSQHADRSAPSGASTRNRSHHSSSLSRSDSGRRSDRPSSGDQNASSRDDSRGGGGAGGGGGGGAGGGASASRGRHPQGPATSSGSGAAGAAAPNSSSASWRDRSVGRGASNNNSSSSSSGAGGAGGAGGGGNGSADATRSSSATTNKRPSGSSDRQSGDRAGSGGAAATGGAAAGSGAAAAGSSDRPTSAGRPRSPKQQRRR